MIATGTRYRVGIALLIAHCLACAGFAQNAASKVAIPVIARDDHRHAAAGLTADALQVKERKTAIDSVELVKPADLPLRMGIVIDVSESVQDRADLDKLVEAIRKFAQDTLTGPDDRVFFLTFADKAGATGWLKREQVANVSIQANQGRGTTLYDTLVAACRERMGPPDWNHLTRRALVVLSDGEDNSSDITMRQTASDILATGVVVFSLATKIDDAKSRGENVLHSFASTTGGEFFKDLTAAHAPKILAELREAIEGMYYVRYESPSSGRKVHEVEIKPVPKQKLDLSYPRTYLAP
jgi:VWFA-related protein